MREEVQTCQNQIAQLNALIAEMEAFDDPGEVFDTLMGFRDDVRVEQAKLIGLNELVSQVKEEIEMKEAQLEIEMKEIGWMKFVWFSKWIGFVWYVFLRFEICSNDRNIFSIHSYVVGCERFCGCLAAFMNIVIVDYCIWCVCFEELDAYLTVGSLAKPYLVYMGPFFILDKLSEVVESPRLVDKMKYVFSHSRGEDESFAGLMRDLYLSLRVSLSKKRRLVTELEADEEVEGVVKCLEHMRVIVDRDAVTLGELETLLGRAHVGVSLKAGFVANMDVKD
nr:hypothetical protein [Tanacetum cinerariifolium]